MTTAIVTKRLRAEGFPIELVRAEGYHYFIFDDGEAFETESIMIAQFRAWPVDRWTQEGRDFAERIKRQLAERADSYANEPGRPIIRPKAP